MNLNNELKQCPFCGREAELRHDEEGFSYVVCANDGCYVRTAGDLNDDAAIRNWNKRDQWIPCSKELPPKPLIGCDGYIVQQYDVVEPFSAYWDGEKWTDVDGNEIEEIIAWQQLPPKFEG